MKEKFDRIHHIAIQVTNIEQSVKWYKKSFACNVSYQDNSWALIEFENTSLSLVLPSKHPPHVAIISENPSIYGQPVNHRDGSSSVYIKDKDGNTIEMIKLKDS